MVNDRDQRAYRDLDRRLQELEHRLADGPPRVVEVVLMRQVDECLAAMDSLDQD